MTAERQKGRETILRQVPVVPVLIIDDLVRPVPEGLKRLLLAEGVALECRERVRQQVPRQRVELLGGTIDIGPSDDGWQVRADVPLPNVDSVYFPPWCPR